jgi:hypothetical protein
VTGRIRQSRLRRYVGLLRPGRQAVLSATPYRRKVPRFPLIDRSVSDQNVEVRFVLSNEGAWAAVPLRAVRAHPSAVKPERPSARRKSISA